VRLHCLIMAILGVFAWTTAVEAGNVMGTIYKANGDLYGANSTNITIKVKTAGNVLLRTVTGTTSSTYNATLISHVGEIKVEFYKSGSLFRTVDRLLGHTTPPLPAPTNTIHIVAP